MKFIIRYGLLLSGLLLVVSYWHRNSWPDTLTLSNELYQEPKQTPLNQSAQAITYNGLSFVIKPRFEYELSGLVVSKRIHQADYKRSIHGLNEDYLNVADLCVVWGDSADPNILQHFTFSSGQFTCNFQTSNEKAWSSFNPNQLSNNHVLATDQTVREILAQSDIGDQITLTGYLADYINPKGYERKTSITRTDTGNGACETLFVEQATVISSMLSPWRISLWLSLIVFIFLLGLYIRRPIQSHHY